MINRLPHILGAVVFAAISSAPTLALGDSLWTMDCSVLRLFEAGQSRIMRFVEPSEEAAYAGEHPNATFFQGHLDGEQLVGAVILRSEVCGDTVLPITGHVQQDSLRIVLTGQSIVRGCLLPTNQVQDHEFILDFQCIAD